MRAGFARAATRLSDDIPLELRSEAGYYYVPQNRADVDTAVRRTTRPTVITLLAFSAIAALATIAVFALTLARLLARDEPIRTSLRALGASRMTRARLGITAPLLAVGTGVLGAVGVALAGVGDRPDRQRPIRRPAPRDQRACGRARPRHRRTRRGGAPRRRRPHLVRLPVLGGRREPPDARRTRPLGHVVATDRPSGPDRGGASGPLRARGERRDRGRGVCRRARRRHRRRALRRQPRLRVEPAGAVRVAVGRRRDRRRRIREHRSRRRERDVSIGDPR